VSAVNQSRLTRSEFLHPRYWLTWAGIGIIGLVCLLPLTMRWRIGTGLGVLSYQIARKRRHIVQTNINLCFPELSESARRQLVKDNFRSSGISIMETAIAWFGDARKFIDIVDIIGLDVLRQAKIEGKGVLLLGMHLSSLDFCGAALSRFEPFNVMYRQNKNRLFESIMTQGRERNFDSAIERDNVRALIRRLKQGGVVWYGPDQDYGHKHSIFADFFGVEAATLTATVRIIRITRSPVIVFSHYRDLATGRYQIYLRRLDNEYPTGDDTADGKHINKIVEAAVRKAPEQYWWLHRRFKTRPPGQSKLY